MMRLSYVLGVFLLVVLHAPPAVRSQQPNKLLILLVDGFRWDYFDKFSTDSELPGFQKWRQDGVAAKYLQPVFPTYSFVNYYSMMTGLYPGINGFIHNYMWDPNHDSIFWVGDNRPEQDAAFWWDDGEPLWITAKKQNKRSYMWNWNGCEVAIRGARPDFCAAYQDPGNSNPSLEMFTSALWQGLEVLRNGSSDMAGVFWEKVDWWGHKEGPDGSNVTARILELDALLVELQEALAADDNINVILFSDHGMARVVEAADSRINVLDYVNVEDIRKGMGSTSGPVLMLWPHEGKLDTMYNALKDVDHMTVYKKEDIPESYHLKEHYRVPPLLLVADEGYAILRINVTQHGQIGYHGYDNTLESMRGIFFAQGPDFKSNLEVDGFINVELYNMMCQLMGIQAAPNNGTASALCHLLKDGCPTGSASSLQLTLAVLLCTVFLVLRQLIE